MVEYIMQYDTDEFGKLINARRKEEVVRCADCVNLQTHDGFGECVLHYTVKKPDGYCDCGRIKK